MGSLNESRTTIRAIGSALRDAFVQGGALKAILFGSYARGEADEHSDIDLIVIAESDRPFVERFKDFMRVWHDSPVKSIDMLVYTPQEFEELRARWNPLVAAVLAEGKVVYEAGPRKRSGSVAAAGGTRSGHR